MYCADKQLVKFSMTSGLCEYTMYIRMCLTNFKIINAKMTALSKIAHRFPQKLIRKFAKMYIMNIHKIIYELS